MNNRNIDIVIPTYNRSGQLRLAIESVFAQTVGDFNLYVLDNCSTDDTAEIASHYESRGLTYIRNPSNLGMVGNWNRALTVGNAPYLLILHDDDELAPEFLATTLPMIEREEGAAFLHSAATIINENGKQQYDRILNLPPSMPGNEFFTRFLKGKMSVICPSVIYNRKVIPSSFHFNEKLPFTADLFFFIGASAYGRVLYSSKPYFRYRVHASSTTSSLVKSIDKKIADRALASVYLQAQADLRAVPDNFKVGAGKSYHLAALSADVWFTRRLGGSYGDVVHVVQKTVSAKPELLRYPRFYMRLAMALLPISIINGLTHIRRRWPKADHA